MSWFWSDKSSAGSTGTTTDAKDVYADLDPQLQAFARSSTHNETANSSSEAAAIPVQDPKATSTHGEEASLSDELLKVIQSSKSRKTQINAGAMFNCALAEYDLNQCFTVGSWWDKSKLCEPQKNAFWDCLESNKKALKILGYAENGNSDAQNAKILDVADDLCMKELAAKKLQKEKEGK